MNNYSSIDSELIPQPAKELPKMNQIGIAKNSIQDMAAFEDLVEVFNLIIIGSEKDYFILDGMAEDLKSFKDFWNGSD